MTTNDSKDQGREAFEAWNDSQTVLEFEDAEAENHALTIFRAGFATALATSASALARDEASVVMSGGAQNFACFLIDKCEGETITEESVLHWLGKMLDNPQYTSPAASSAATVSDAASVQDERAAFEELRGQMAYIAAYSPDEADSMSKDRLAGRLRAIIDRARIAVSAARAASSATAPLTSDSDAVQSMDAAEIAEFERTVEEFIDDGETSTDYEILMGWARRGLLECTHFTVTKTARDLIDRAQSTNGEAKS